MLAMLFGCGFRRSELVGLEVDEIQMQQGHWAVVDLIGKGGHIRTVPIPQWVKAALDQWVVAARRSAYHRGLPTSPLLHVHPCVVIPRFRHAADWEPDIRRCGSVGLQEQPTAGDQ